MAGPAADPEGVPPYAASTPACIGSGGDRRAVQRTLRDVSRGRAPQPPAVAHSARRFCQPPGRALNKAARCKPRPLHWRSSGGSPQTASASALLALDYSRLQPHHHAEDVVPNPANFFGRLLADYLPAALAARRADPAGACCCAANCADPARFFSYRRACLNGEQSYGRLLSAISLEP